MYFHQYKNYLAFLLQDSHRAGSRDMFARGALLAVKFLMDAPAGLYDMQDVLGLK